MKRILFVVYGYTGRKSSNANAICAKRIIDNLKLQADITVITDTDRAGGCANKINDNGVSVYEIFAGNVGNNAFLWPVNRFYNAWVCSATKFAIQHLNRIRYDLVISVSYPFWTSNIAKNISKALHAKWFLYELDPYYFNQVNKRSKLSKSLAYIREVTAFQKADKILLTNELYNQYIQEAKFATFKDKFVKIGIPALDDIAYSETKVRHDPKPRLIYAGAFYDHIRKPDYMLRLLLDICSRHNFKLLLYSKGCEETLNRYKRLYNGYLDICGFIEPERLYESLCASDFLVNIGNTVTNQVPSKLFEYMATGKPIIHFYSMDNDTCLPYLANYPLHISIKEAVDEYEYNRKSTEKFCLEKIGCALDSTVVSEALEGMLAANIAKRIYRLVGE
jgi:glycosyltransferase involved in cell wall biosynthesis